MQNMNVEDKIKQLPSSPGVYLMKDGQGGVLYVGKSKNLKARVQSYFQSSANLSPKTKRLVRHLKDFDYIPTDTELEAFLLECKLIKNLKPIYNRVLKKHEAYTYLLIKSERGLRRIKTVAGVEGNDNCLCFGPFSNKIRVEETLRGLKRFLSIDCNSLEKNGPCLNHSLGFCLGHCHHQDKRADYERMIDRIIHLFQGKDKSIFGEMEEEMNRAAVRLDFERAAELKKTMDSLQSLVRKEEVARFTRANHKIILMEALEKSTVKVFFIHRNKILLKKKINVNQAKPKHSVEKLATWAVRYFGQNFSASLFVNKEEMDQSQIIFTYLQNNPCNHAFIEDSLLAPENRKQLTNLLTELLKKSKKNS